MTEFVNALDLSPKYRAIFYRGYGDFKVLEMGQFTLRRPTAGEILVRVKGVSVNPADDAIRSGKWNYPIQFPAVPGWDAAGIVEKVGSGVSRFKIGDHVFGYLRRDKVSIDGAFAEYVCLPETFWSLKPKKASFPEAATIPLAGLTAYQGLMDYGGLKKGQSVVIIGASGGVGSFAVQLAKIMGASTIIGITSDLNSGWVRSLGATHTVDYKKGYDEVVNEIKTIEAKGVDLVFDTSGDAETAKLRDVFADKQGTWISIASGKPADLPGNITWKTYVVTPNTRELDHLARLYDEGAIQPTMTTVLRGFNVKNAVEAHNLISSHHTTGKIGIDFEGS